MLGSFDSGFVCAHFTLLGIYVCSLGLCVRSSFYL